MRAVVLASTGIFLASACGDQDRLPTVPVGATPTAAILGADVASLPLVAVAINESGQVAGTRNGHATLWTPGGAMEDLGTLGGTSSWPYAINASGQVAGASLTSTGETHAFLWTPGVGMQDLGTFGGGTSSTARGINDLGQVVGEVILPVTFPFTRPEMHAFLWTPGQGMQDLGTLRQDLRSTIAYDINNAGQVVGRAFFANRLISPPTDPEYLSRAFLWAPGQGMRDLGDLGGGSSVAHAINDAGQVVGRSWAPLRPDYDHYVAFLWTEAEGMRAIGQLWDGPETSVAYAISEAGHVVGENELLFIFPGIPSQAFLWSASEGTEALTPTTGFREARAINSRHEVVGGGGRVATLHLEPGNSPPTAVTGGPYIGTNGSPVALAMSAIDNDDVGFWYRVSFGDGSSDWFDLRPPRSYTYAANGTYTLTLTVRDRRGATDTKTTTVTIGNVAPTIVAGSLTGPTAPIGITGGSASAPISFAFSDPAGSRDVYSAEIACGNGVTLAPTAITSPYSIACPYTRAGVFTIRVTVSDQDGATSAPAFYRYVVVYDPTGGSISGNGFYTIAGHKKRKAHFTFSAGFASTNAAAPNGTARFWIPGEHFDFESTAMEMVVVAGDWAQLWGTGSLNGVPARFRITAIDGPRRAGHTGDAFRIEIWQADALVFDTQSGAPRDAPVTTRLDGGNVRIRREWSPIAVSFSWPPGSNTGGGLRARSSSRPRGR